MAKNLVRTGIRFTLFFGVIILSPCRLQAGELLHPTLVVPATTRCTVCHGELEATHNQEALEQDCLSCHSFVSKANNTYLLEEADRRGVAPPPGADDGQSSGSVAGSEAGDLPRDLPPSSPPARAESIPVGSGAPVIGGAGDLYAEGLAAFSRRDFQQALASWQTMLEGADRLFTLQVAVNRYLVSAQDAIESNAAHSLFVVPKGDQYYVLAGLFYTRAEAASALARLPETLRSGGAFPIAVQDLVQGR